MSLKAVTAVLQGLLRVNREDCLDCTSALQRLQEEQRAVVEARLRRQELEAHAREKEQRATARKQKSAERQAQCHRSNSI